MNIDWAVAMGSFLLFVIWAFAFYGQVFVTEDSSVASAMEMISDKVMENITVKVHKIPVKVWSPSDQSNAEFYLDYIWPFGKNSTKIYINEVSQRCEFDSDRIYWMSNVVSGYNYFDMYYFERDSNLSCNSTVDSTNATLQIPFTAEETEQISGILTTQMSNTDYSDFKAALGISRDFNITIENATHTRLTYGLLPPKASNVFSREITSKLAESQQNVTVRFLVW